MYACLTIPSFGSYKNVIDIIAKTQISISDVTTNTHRVFYFITIFLHFHSCHITASNAKRGVEEWKNFSVRYVMFMMEQEWNVYF
jgi:hypothetical protein